MYRLQRLVLPGLGRTLLSSRRETRRLSPTLLKRLQRCRNRLHILPHTLTTNGRQLAENNPRNLSLHRKVSEEDNPRAEAARQPRPAGTLLQVHFRAKREARRSTNPASALLQLQERQGSPGNLRWPDRPEIQTCDRVPKQVLVQTRHLQATREQERNIGLVGEPVRIHTPRGNLRHRLPQNGGRQNYHQLRRHTERPVTSSQEMVRHAGGEIEPLQTGIHLLQQPLRRIRARVRQRVPQISRTSRARLEGYDDRSRTITK